MTDKKLIQQLNKLKNLVPQTDWQKDCRQVLLTQINNSGGRQSSAWQKFWIDFKCLSNLAYRPVMVVAGFLILLVSASLFSHQWLETSKPNDSLYIARVISERARLSTVLDSASRERLAALFAMAHAEDISAILADPNFDLVANSAQVDKLNQDFSREIAVAKDRVSSWQKQQDQSAADALLSTDQEPASSVSPSEEDDLIFIADNQKDEQGLEVLAGQKGQEQAAEAETTTAVEPEAEELDELADDLKAEIAEIKEVIKDKEEDELDSNQVLDLLIEAELLFNQTDFEGAQNKLKEARDSMK